MRRIAPWAALWSLVALPAWASSEGSSHLGVPDSLWLPINLAVFLYLLYRFVGKPLGAFLESRRESIGQELEQAKQKLAEAEELRARVLGRLAEVEQEVGQIKERAESQGRAEAERIGEQTRVEEERFLRRVDEEISRRQADTRHRLAEEMATLTAQLARELLEREITDADRERILERSMKALKKLDD